MHLKCTSSLSHLHNLYFKNNCNSCIVVNFVLHICTQSWSDSNAFSFKQVIPEGHLKDNDLCLHNQGLKQIAAVLTVGWPKIHIFSGSSSSFAQLFSRSVGQKKALIRRKSVFLDTLLTAADSDHFL